MQRPVSYEFQINSFDVDGLLLASSASFARHGFSQCQGEGVDRRPQLRHCPGLAGAKCIGWPEQKYISDAGEQGPELGAFVARAC
jgi:hypothetical protein